MNTTFILPRAGTLHNRRANKEKDTGSAETLRVTALPVFCAMYDFDAWILKLCPCGSAVGQSRFRRPEGSAQSPNTAYAPTCFDADSLRFVLPFSGKRNAPKSYKKALISKKSRLFWWGRVDLPLRGIYFESGSKHGHPPKGGCPCFGGGGWIRTTVGIASRFTVCPLWPLGNTPVSSPQAPDRLASGQGRKLAPFAAAPLQIEADASI